MLYIFESFARIHWKHAEYDYHDVYCLSLLIKWWRNFRKIKSRDSKRHIKILQRSRFVFISFDRIQRKIIQFQSTISRDNKNINFFCNWQRHCWSSIIKFLDDANEIKLIAQSKYYEIVREKDLNEHSEDYVWIFKNDQKNEKIVFRNQFVLSCEDRYCWYWIKRFVENELNKN